MKNLLALIMIVGVAFSSTAQKDNSKLKRIGGGDEESLTSLGSLSSLSQLSQLAELSSLASLSQLSQLSELSSLASLADQADIIILPAFDMELTDDMNVMLEDMEELNDIQIDLSDLQVIDMSELNRMIREALNKGVKNE